MKWILILKLCILSMTFAFSQGNLISLHPLIGDTVSYQEKIDYLLFTEVVDTNYLFGLLYSNDSNNYYLISYHSTDSAITKIDSGKISEYRLNIDKLYAFYTSQSKPDTIHEKGNLFLIDSISHGFNKNFISPEMSKQIGRDARRYQGLNNAADKQGLKGQDKENYINTGGYGEIRFKKK